MYRGTSTKSSIHRDVVSVNKTWNITGNILPTGSDVSHKNYLLCIIFNGD